MKGWRILLKQNRDNLIFLKILFPQNSYYWQIITSYKFCKQNFSMSKLKLSQYFVSYDIGLIQQGCFRNCISVTVVAFAFLYYIIESIL